MNALLADLKAILLSLLGVCFAALGFFVRRDFKRLDNVDDRLKDIEGKYVTHDDISELRASLTATITNAVRMMSEDRSRMHRENRDAAKELRGMVTRIDARVDDLWRRPG